MLLLSSQEHLWFSQLTHTDLYLSHRCCPSALSLQSKQDRELNLVRYHFSVGTPMIPLEGSVQIRLDVKEQRANQTFYSASAGPGPVFCNQQYPDAARRTRRTAAWHENPYQICYQLLSSPLKNSKGAVISPYPCSSSSS